MLMTTPASSLPSIHASSIVSRRASHMHWPLWAALLVFTSVFGIQLYEILQLTHGRQLYPLDDVYIHAAVAKNLVLHHVYGVTSFHSSFPSSSILWPFVIAMGFMVVGVKAWVPLALNFLFSILYLLFADYVLKVLAPSIASSLRFAALLLLVLGVPLVGLSFEGMEHVLQALALLILMLCYYRFQLDRSTMWRGLLALAAAFAVSVRYESLFAVLMIALLLAWRRQWVEMIGVGAAALLPVMAFGIFATLHGSTFLPTPLLLKTSSSMQTSAWTAARNLFSTYSILSGITVSFFIAAAMLVFLVRHPAKKILPLRDLFFVLVGTFLLHAQLAQFGWLFRYEAYLLATTVVLAFAALPAVSGESRGSSWRGGRWTPLGLVAILAVALAGRGGSMLRGVPRNAQAIYEQQYQTARFLAAFYPGQVVGLNDIGAPDFYADIRCVDLLGLASGDVARLRRSGKFTEQSVTDLARQSGIRIAALYPGLFAGRIPRTWIPVSTLVVKNLPGKVQLGERGVTLYAANGVEAVELGQHLQEFRSQLPRGVQMVAPDSPETLAAKTELAQSATPIRTNKFVAWVRAGLDGLSSKLQIIP